MKQVYLDNAATTPVRLEAEAAMRPYFCEKYGNPSGVYQISSENRSMIENVREQIAKTLNASAEEIYFTSGGTESDNWAIKAAAQMLKEKGQHIITSKIEHHAILNSCAYLEKQGFETERGYCDLPTSFKAVKKGTGKGPVVAFLAEYDALRGVGHGCGHNVIATCASGAFASLAKIFVEMGIAGEVRIIGTPAEEGGAGKAIMLERGGFDGVDFALMIHPTCGGESRNYINRNGRASGSLTISFTGQSAHSSAPATGINALTAADSVIIPVQAEYFALEGISKLLNTIKIIKSKLNPALEIEGFLLTMYDSRLRQANQIYDEVKKHFQELVFNSVIQRNVKLSEAPSYGIPTILYDADSTGAKNHLALAKEIINRNK